MLLLKRTATCTSCWMGVSIIGMWSSLTVLVGHWPGPVLVWKLLLGRILTVLCAIKAGRHLKQVPDNFHTALEHAAARGYATSSKRSWHSMASTQTFGVNWNPPLFSLLYMAIVPSWRCCLLQLILIRMLEINGVPHRCKAPAIRI